MEKIENLAKQYIYWPELEKTYQKNVDFSKNTLGELVKILYHDLKGDEISPEESVLKFYTLNQYLSEKRIKENDILDNNLIEVYKDYKGTVENLSQKLFSYIFMISLMESRHCYDFNLEENLDYLDLLEEYESTHPKVQSFERNFLRNGIEKYKSACPPDFYPAFKKCYSHLFNEFKNSQYNYRYIAQRAVDNFTDSNITIEAMLKTFKIILNRNNFEEGYGGYVWGDIANHALRYAKGEINSEVFVDQAFSLEHNNGSVFNKEAVFSLSEYNNFKIISFNNINESNIAPYQELNIMSILLELQHKGELISLLKLCDMCNNDTGLTQLIVGSHLKEIEKKPEISSIKFEDLSSINTENSVKNIINEISEVLKPYLENESIKKILKDSSVMSTSKVSFEDAYIDNDGYISNAAFYVLKLASEISSKIINYNVEPVLEKTNSVLNKNEYEFFYTKNIPKNKQKKEVLGGKAYGLNQMTQLELPVPPSVVWTCDNSQSYLENSQKWLNNLKNDKEKIENFNKNSKNEDIMVSIRSGAPISMPGMMDTILNVGIDDTNYEYFVKKLGKNVADDCSIRFMKLFTKSYFDINDKWPEDLIKAQNKFKKILKKYNIPFSGDKFPLTKSEQITYSIEAVFKSWNSERAIAYRTHNKISHTIGTAAIMQHMVLGNLNHESCTGVLFSRDCITGNSGLIGEYLVNAQGEEVVSGEVTPSNITEMKEWNPKVYNQLKKITTLLEKETGQIQDIEFTVEDGQLYILQCRTAVSSPDAKLKIQLEQLSKNEITVETFLKNLEVDTLNNSLYVDTKEENKYSGLCANPGIISGICVTNSSDIAKYEDMAKRSGLKLILISKQTAPEQVPLMIKTDAFLTQEGGFTSHAAILARSWNKPCIVGAKDSHKLKSGDIITMDAKLGKVWEGVQKLNNKDNKDLLKKIIKKSGINEKTINENTKELVKEINSNEFWFNCGSKTKTLKAPVVKKFNTMLNMGQSAVMKVTMAVKKEEQEKELKSSRSNLYQI